MTNSGTAAKAHVDRMASVLLELAELQSDMKELKIAAKADGFDAGMLARWAKAIVADTKGKLAKQTQTMHDIGEQLFPDLFGHVGGGKEKGPQ